jgi:putative membrane protein
MATATAKRRAKDNPRATAAVLSVLGYVLVLGTFAGLIPIYPELERATVDLLSHAIAVVNTAALTAIVLGVRWIKRGEVRKHRAAMLTAFGLIIAFLALYLVKVGGGGEKAIAATGPVYYAYLVMLAIHIVLSVVAVPVVVYAVVLGLTHTPAELRDTAHARVGRWAAGAWGLSLALGIVTYLMLNHVYGVEEYMAALAPLAAPLRRRR